MRLLLIEDEVSMVGALCTALEDSYVVDVALTGEEGVYQALLNEYDAILVDWGLPDTTGIKVCLEIREHEVHVPILFLTGRSAVADTVRALDAGADDYLTKPFRMEELEARLRALMRRNSDQVASNILECDELRMDLAGKTAERAGRALALRKKEFSLLEYFMRNQGRVLTRSMILEHVWGSEIDPITNTVDVHIKRLRDKIDKPFETPLIRTVYGVGYKIGE